jgi:predicted ATPase
MLTRIEIDGFKTFEDFGLDLGPFVVILGPNASGKSNLFDAIRLLSHLAGTDLRTAVKTLRGEPQELFRRQADGSSVTRMAFAVELLLAPEVRDPWGDTVKISHSRMRYEVEIERRKDERGIERLVVAREEAKPILAQSDKWRPKKQELSAQFKQLFMKYGRRTPWLTTGESDGKRSFKINQDGRKGRTRPAEAAEATVLSSITSAEFPHLYALREEMRSWRFLQLDPNALRRPSPTTAALELEPDGANLAAVLARIQAETATGTRPKGDLADIAADLTSLIPGVVGVSIEEDEKNREYRIDIDMRDGHPFSSRVVSDGTLRVLALLTLLHDPKHRGLVCFEEPENGVHPFRLKAMIERLRELVTDPTSDEVDEQEPLSQMLLNSHSPVVLSCLEKDEAMFADMVSVVNPEVDKISRKTRIRPVKLQGELLPEENREYVSMVEVERYLHSVDQEG